MCLYTVQRSVRTWRKILRESETKAGGGNVAGRKYRLSESKLKLGKKTEKDKGKVRDTMGRVEWPKGGNTIQVICKQGTNTWTMSFYRVVWNLTDWIVSLEAISSKSET